MSSGVQKLSVIISTYGRYFGYRRCFKPKDPLLIRFISVIRGKQTLVSDDRVIRIGTTVAEKLPGVAHFLDLVHVEIRDY